MRSAILAVVLACASQAGQDLTPERFGDLHRLVKPQAGEFAWYDDIPWLTSVQAAREMAAAEGKPLLVWCSADGQPCGAT
jgi:hypothetical protein